MLQTKKERGKARERGKRGVGLVFVGARKNEKKDKRRRGLARYRWKPVMSFLKPASVRLETVRSRISLLC